MNFLRATHGKLGTLIHWLQIALTNSFDLYNHEIEKKSIISSKHFHVTQMSSITVFNNPCAESIGDVALRYSKCNEFAR